MKKPTYLRTRDSRRLFRISLNTEGEFIVMRVWREGIAIGKIPLFIHDKVISRLEVKQSASGAFR